MSDEHAHDDSGPAEGEYTDADHADGSGAIHHAGSHTDQVEGEYTDGVYSADGREVHLEHHGEGAYTDADHGDVDHTGTRQADAVASGAVVTGDRAADRAGEDEGEYTDGDFPDDGTDAGRTGAPHS
ncbi:hypothetical protein AB0N64_10595 [Microbacterium sp. NPDC089318]